MEQILLFILESFAIIYILKNIFHSMITKSKIRLTLSAVTFLIGLLYCLLYKPVIPLSVFTVILILLLFQENLQIALCQIAIYLLTFNIITGGISQLILFLTHKSPKSSEIYYLSSMLGLLTILIISITLRQKFFREERPFRKLDWQGYLLITFVLLVDFFLTNTAYFLIHDELNSFGKSMLILSIFVMIIMSIILLILYFHLQMLHAKLQEKDQLNQEMLRLEENHYKELQKKNLDLRAFRHDYNYHVTSLHALAEKEDFKALKQYIETLSGIKEQIQYLSTGQPISDAIVNYFYENLPDGVSFELSGRFSEELFLSDTDLCVILSNLLKNAIEAADSLSKKEDRKIFLSLFSNRESLLIQIENTSKEYKKEDLTQLPTSKEDTLNHGFGIENVRKSVKKYNGKLELYFRSGVFSASVYIHR